MKSNEEFKQLVDSKYKTMVANRRNKQRILISTISCLTVCFIVFGIFISNGGFGNLFNPRFYETAPDASAPEESEEKESIFSSNEFAEEVIGSNDCDGSTSFKDEAQQPSTPLPDYKDESIADEEYEEDSFWNDLSDFNSQPEGIPETSEEPLSPEYPNEPSEGDIPDPDISEITDALNRDQYHGVFDMATRSGIGDFAFELFANSYSAGKNNLLSPTAAIYSLSMLSNATSNDLQNEMASILCGQDPSRLNCFVYNFCNFFCETIAGAIWYECQHEPNDTFLQINKDYYGIELYDRIDKNDINDWFKRKCGISDSDTHLGSSAGIVATNTVFVEDSWRIPLDISEEKLDFTTSSGAVKQVSAMHGYAEGYFETEDCIGIIKRFRYDYNIAVFYPTDEQSLYGLIEKLDNEYFMSEIIYGAKMRQTKLTIPIFDVAEEQTLKDSIIKSGIVGAFDKEASVFDKTFGKDSYLADVLQGVTLSLNENGTMDADKVEMPDIYLNPDAESITFDRPFVYVIYEKITRLPVLIGTIENFE